MCDIIYIKLYISSLDTTYFEFPNIFENQIANIMNETIADVQQVVFIKQACTHC